MPPDNSYTPDVSIVIPTRNEQEDILKTLESLRTQSHAAFEVLVVDASRDRTPDIVRNFGDPRFHLLPQDNFDGRCGARNQGIREARAPIVVILNADVRLPSDFLKRILPHYQKGADYLIVDSGVENIDHPFGLFVEAVHQLLYRNKKESYDWCEGYSCRKTSAIEAGLFPVGFPVAMCAGEDAVFGQAMEKKFKRAEDWSLVVKHRVPESWKGFWGTRSEKGRGVPQRRYWIDGWPRSQILKESFFWLIKSIGWFVLVYPWIQKAKLLASVLPEEKNEWKVLIFPILFDRIAHEIGRWQGVKMVLQHPTE